MIIIESLLKLKQPSLTGNEIKLIACVSMLAAHLVQSGLWDSLCTSTVWSQIGFYLNCTIGRIAFPLFAFFIAEGATKTHNIREYIARMAIFALFSEIPFNLVFFGQSVCWDTQNVGLTFLFSLCFIYLIQLSEDSDLPRWGKISAHVFPVSLLSLADIIVIVITVPLVLLVYWYSTSANRYLSVYEHFAFALCSLFIMELQNLGHCYQFPSFFAIMERKPKTRKNAAPYHCYSTHSTHYI